MDPWLCSLLGLLRTPSQGPERVELAGEAGSPPRPVDQSGGTWLPCCFRRETENHKMLSLFFPPPLPARAPFLLEMTWHLLSLPKMLLLARFGVWGKHSLHRVHFSMAIPDSEGKTKNRRLAAAYLAYLLQLIDHCSAICQQMFLFALCSLQMGWLPNVGKPKMPGFRWKETLSKEHAYMTTNVSRASVKAVAKRLLAIGEQTWPLFGPRMLVFPSNNSNTRAKTGGKYPANFENCHLPQKKNRTAR